MSDDEGGGSIPPGHPRSQTPGHPAHSSSNSKQLSGPPQLQLSPLGPGYSSGPPALGLTRKKSVML